MFALGIAATTTVFSVVNAVLLRPFPWPHSDKLVIVHAVEPERRSNPAYALTWNRSPISWAAWTDLRRAPVFDEVGAWFPDRQVIGPARTEFVDVMYVSTSFLDVLAISPAIGRTFVPDEDSGPSDTAVISYESWQRFFGGRPDILGQRIVLSTVLPGSSLTEKIVVGVLPPRFSFQGLTPAVMVPIGIMEWSGSFETNRFLRAVARLRNGVSIDAALAVAEPLIRRDEPREKRTARLLNLTEDQTGESAAPLWILFGGAGLLLLVSCSNVAGLLLGDTRARRHEIAIRTALGGGRRAFIRQLLAEQGLIALTSAAIGVVLALWLVKGVVLLAPPNLPGLENVSVDFRVATFGVLTALVTALCFGIAPASSIWSVRPSELLAEGGRQATASGSTVQKVAVATQLGLAVVLVVSALLYGETAIRLSGRPLGFEPSNVIILRVALTQYPGFGNNDLQKNADFKSVDGLRTARKEFERRMAAGWLHTEGALDSLRAVGGITSAAAANAVPFAGVPSAARVQRHGDADHTSVLVQRHMVSEDYFRVFGAKVLRGRAFERADRERDTAIISREMELRLFEGQAVGKQLVNLGRIYDVIGVVDNVVYRKKTDEPSMSMYTLNRAAHLVRYFAVRANDPDKATPLARDVIKAYDPHLVVEKVTTSKALVSVALAEERFRTALSTAFGLAALLLSGIGVYGLMSRTVIDSRREFGVRMALGASPSNVRALVIRNAVATVALGLVAGVPLAVVASYIASAQLYGVSPLSPHVFVIAVATLVTTAFLAALLPAVRATRIDPAVALRQ